ncbi:3-hydroxyacyl-CoA dehydrogenase NAD-binding domain-containing protein [Streptosporangium sp. NBC_01755]|uniref:3-hydroxyacyl-CoA dehydrogenase NAD-binding domain-containing protein n=1 Tax=Streptosporangium sp. NBC_01755 TaxID=2975949 RepID=UPI002DD89748|nr:3-hydroxyacyl-CoA dehydrogenase NAD-binding domain-containing protein [Streptosporangium sp. NBC_01755]
MTGSFETVGVAGLGTMGAGIAECFARAGIAVIGVEAGPETLTRGRGHLEDSTGRAVAKCAKYAKYAKCREPFLAPVPLPGQLVAAGVRSLRDLP